MTVEKGSRHESDAVKGAFRRITPEIPQGCHAGLHVLLELLPQVVEIATHFDGFSMARSPDVPGELVLRFVVFSETGAARFEAAEKRPWRSAWLTV